MSILTRIKRAFTPVQPADTVGRSTGVVTTVFDDKSDVALPMEVAAVYRCVTLISNAIGSMPLRYMRRGTDGAKYEATGSPLAALLRFQPNIDLSAYDFWRLAVRRMLFDGVVYIVPRRSGAESPDNWRRLELYQRTRVTYNSSARSYTVRPDISGGESETLDEKDIIVLRHTLRARDQSESAMDYAGKVVNLAGHADAETLARVKDGGAPRLLLSSESMAIGVGGAVESALNDYATYIERKTRENRSHLIAMPAGVKGQQIGASSVDLQLQSVREYGVRDICRYFGVPPIYVYSDSSSNYKSAEMASVDFLANTLDPILRGIEAELTRKLLPRSAWFTDELTFDRDSRVAADSDSRARYLGAMLGTGGYTVNDIRRHLGKAPVEGGDTPLVSANLRPLNIQDNKDIQNHE